MNNINFGARYNLSDKANLFSLTERVKLSSAVKKLNKDDLFSIGTRKYNKVDISDKASEDALIQMGGKRQVPFIVDNDRNIQMYESDDIIEYLKTVL